MSHLFERYFDRMAELVRLLYLYGCFSNESFDSKLLQGKTNHSIIASQADFRKHIAAPSQVLGDIIGFRRVNGKKHKYISPDRFDDNEESFANLYRLADINETQAMRYLEYMLDIFHKSDAPVCPNDKYKKELDEYFGDDADNKRLAELSAEELEDLFMALRFCSRKTPYKIAGKMACDRINDILENRGEVNALAEYSIITSYNSMGGLLSDNNTYKIFTAIKERCFIVFRQKSKEVAAQIKRKKDEDSSQQYMSKNFYLLPVKVFSEYVNGRSYCFGWSETRRSFCIYRIDDMFDITYSSEDPKGNKASEIDFEALHNEANAVSKHIFTSYKYKHNEKLQKISFDWYGDPACINSCLPNASISDAGQDKCHVEAEMYNYKDMIPFLRMNIDRVNISKEGSAELYNDIKSDLEEVLTKYGAL